jgi:circadian clock protein KaiC
MTDTQPMPSSRLATGVKGLDVILQGGLIPKRIYLLTGAAGVGKTILANQLCFHHIAAGGRAVYVTLVEEIHSQLFDNLAPFTFFSREPMNRTLHYFSGSAALDKEGLQGLLEMLKEIIPEQHTSLLVVDSLLMLETDLENKTSLQSFIKQLSAFVEVQGCTVVLLSYPSPDSLGDLLNILVDGVIELTVETVEQRVVRNVQVLKLRGSGYLEGCHTFQIAEPGILVHPRIESRFVQAPRLAYRAEARVSLPLGIPNLDKMLHGGIFAGSNTMLFGIPGSGKTITGLHFLAAGAQRDEAGLYFGFYETPEYLLTKADQVGLDLSRLVQNGSVEVLWQPPLENLLDNLAEQLLEAVRRRNVRRLFLDGLAGFQQAADFPQRINRFFTALTTELRGLEVTTFFSIEMQTLFGPTVEFPLAGISIIADNVIFLRSVELHSQLYRMISILKLRDSDYEMAIREFTITAHGIEVADTFQSAQAILTGVAMPINIPPPASKSGKAT